MKHSLTCQWKLEWKSTWGILLSLELSPAEEGFPFTISQNTHGVNQKRLNISSDSHNKIFFPCPPTDNRNDLELGNKEETSFSL